MGKKMNNKTSTKRILMTSVLSLILCVVMLIGTTFAWFTDNVTSGKNIIKSGNLDLEMYWTDDLNSDVWHNVEDEAYNTIFSYDNWEPGYTEVKYIKLVNKGNLALNYKLALTPAGEVGKLAEVINVFYAEDSEGVEVKNREDLSDMNSIGLLKNAMDGRTTANGTLLAANQQSPIHTSGETIVTLAMNMITTAGNDYQNESIGDGFTITALATQCAYEEDTFGSDYDSSAEYPEIIVPGKVSASVTPDNGKVPAGGVTLAGDGLSAIVPEGVALKDGAEKLTLTVKPLENTTTDITVVNNEILIPVDVHIEGVAEDNTVPIIINLGAIMPKYLNMGNYTLIHVEDGTNQMMQYVEQGTKLTTHNQFQYDPLTGEVIVAMASFSEVAVLADTANVWQGKISETGFSGGDGTEANPYIVANADELAYMADRVSNDNATYGAKYYQLISDLNFGGTEYEKIFYPIGYWKRGEGANKAGETEWYTYGGTFSGTFDGMGHQISGIYQNTWAMDGNYDNGYYKEAMGLFGYVYGGTVENLTIDNFYSEGEFTPTGCVTAYAAGTCTFKNIAITESHPHTYNTGVAGIVGWDNGGDTTGDASSFNFTNITIDETNTISALWGSWDVAAAGLLGYLGEYSSATLVDCHLAPTIDVYNDVCGNYQYYWYRYCGMVIGTVDRTKEDGSLDLANDLAKIEATNCTVNFGDRHEYYYCEFEKNSPASYSEDYQFSRVEHSDLKFTDSNSNGRVDVSETKTVTGCTHTHTDNEDKQAVHIPFYQLFGGYGWGVDGVDLNEYVDGNGNRIIDITVITKAQEKFVTKFVNSDTYLYRVGNANAVSIGSLFEAASSEDEYINDAGVYVTIDKVDEETNVSGVFKANTSDWTKGTIQFSGTGVVKLTIQDYKFCAPTVLYVEVVDAKNITSATGSNGTDVVLLSDVKINSGSTVTYDNCIVYGNGFTFDATGGLTKYVASQGWGVINLSNGATLDNMVIKGDIYEEYGAYSENNYNTAAVASLGGTIQNCHISNCAAPVMARGTTTVEDTTLYGGTVANMIIKAGVNTLENVTTVNYADGRDLVGMGIVIHSDADETTKLVLNGTLKQYNFVCESDIPSDSNAKLLYDAMFDDECSGYHFESSPNRYVNTGIISMVETFNLSDITDEETTDYQGNAVSTSGVKGYVYTQPNTSGAVDNDYVEANDSHKASVQGDYLPTFEFELGEQEISYDGDGDSRYLYGDASGVQALYQDGDDAISLDLTKLATIYKYSNKYYAVSAICKDSSGGTLTATNGVVTLSVSGQYSLVFTVEDNVFYDQDGNEVTKSVERTYTVPLTLSVKAADIKDAVVTISSTTLKGDYVTVNLTDYKLRLYFLESIDVIDYDSAGNGTAVDLTANISSGAFSVPSRTDGNIWEAASVITITYSDGRELTVNLSDFAGSSPGTKTANVVTNNGVYFLTDGALNNKPTEEANKCTCTITSVTFKGNNGATITNDTDVSVSWPLGSSSSGNTPCVTPDTLVTLADGTRKEIQHVTYEDDLLVWDFFNGEYTTAKSSIIMNHGYNNYKVVTLNFADGTVVNTINGHGFFDQESKEFVILSEANAEDYIGHNFIKQDGTDNTVTQLISYSVSEEYTESWSILTAEHYNCILEGMLTLTPAEVDESPKYLMPFEIGEELTYKYEVMDADIEKYGLYTYEEFADMLTYEQFHALNLQYFKVAVGKEFITYEEILYLIDLHME